MPAEPLATMHTAANSDNLTLPSGALWGPGASVTPEEALQSHTVGGAVACNLEPEIGVLRYALCSSALGRHSQISAPGRISGRQMLPSYRAWHG